jgi:hypothetical protein
MDRPFNDAWLVLKQMRQSNLGEYEGHAFEELQDLPMPNKRQKIAVPTHINRMPNDEGGIEYGLMSDDTELGRIINDMEVYNRTIENFGGSINPEYRRQGLYQKLLNALIQNNYKIISNDRNEQSHSTHKKFQENLPDNVEFTSTPEGLWNAPVTSTEYEYEKKPTEMIGGMQRYDYGGLPIRNVENPEIVEYEKKPIHQRMMPLLSDPNTPFRQFMRLDEFSE